MENITQEEKAGSEIALRFLFAILNRVDRDAVVTPIMERMDSGAHGEKKLLDAAISDILELLSLMEEGGDLDMDEYVDLATVPKGPMIYAEAFARAAQGAISQAVLKMAMPPEAEENRTIAYFEREGFPRLAELSRRVAPGDLRIQ